MSKPAFGIILINVIVSATFAAIINGFVLVAYVHDGFSIGVISVYSFVAVITLFSPLSGFLADVYCGRYRVINPLRMRRRVTVVCLCVCVCVCLSVTTLVASLLSYTAQMRYQCFQYDNSKVFNSWILLKLFCSKVMVLTLTCRRHFLPYIA